MKKKARKGIAESRVEEQVHLKSPPMYSDCGALSLPPPGTLSSSGFARPSSSFCTPNTAY